MTSRGLSVVLYERRVGRVEQSASGRRTFSYDRDYLSEPDATPLSLSMPLSGGTYAARRIDPFLLGLLPDNVEVRERWGSQFGVNGANPFALLEHMGADCAGAVEFTNGSVDEMLARAGVLTTISDDEIGARLKALRSDDSAWTVPGERWSLAGAQGKFALAQSDGVWCEATGAAPSTHIVKPGVVGYREQALNEHVCMVTARALGLSAARTDYTEFAGEPALVVTRYDRRRTAAGFVLRVHQEDVCQALSVFPHRKYEASGGPTAARIARLLRDVATDPGADVVRFVQALAFNYLLGAPDAHAKNYSLLLAGRQVRLAPLYDVASALPYEPSWAGHELDQAAMGVGGRKVFGTVEGRHWDKLAHQCGLDREQVREIVTRLASSIPEALEAAFAPYRTSGLRERMLARVAHLCRTTLRLL